MTKRKTKQEPQAEYMDPRLTARYYKGSPPLEFLLEQREVARRLAEDPTLEFQGLPAHQEAALALIDQIDALAQRPTIAADEHVVSDFTRIRAALCAWGVFDKTQQSLLPVIARPLKQQIGARNARPGAREVLDNLARAYLAQSSKVRKPFPEFVAGAAEQAKLSQSRARLLLRERHNLPGCLRT